MLATEATVVAMESRKPESILLGVFDFFGVGVAVFVGVAVCVTSDSSCPSGT